MLQQVNFIKKQGPIAGNIQYVGLGGHLIGKDSLYMG
jgi:hypothetical protein